MRAGIIDSPSKIGVGTYQRDDSARLLDDIDLLHANWFYTWGPRLAPWSVAGWQLGADVAVGGSASDKELQIGGKQGWAVQDVAVAPLQTYSLGFAATGSGAVLLEFRDAAGAKLGGDWLPVSAAAGGSYAASALTPAGTASAHLVAYTSGAEALALDDVSLVVGGSERLANGGFETARSTAADPTSARFVPMIWGSGDMASLATAKASGSDTLLAFNEPDYWQQSNMTVTQALANWPALMATGMRLGSPATTTGGTLGANSWLGKFIAGADAKGYRVDFVAVHYYTTNPDAAAFQSWLQQVYNAYHRPIWVTEWSLADWAHPDRFSADQQAAFFRAASQMMDDLPFVERHAWFSTYDGLGGWDLNSGLLGPDGQASVVGGDFHALAGTVNGSAGDDALASMAGDDAIDGAAGYDSVAYAGARAAYLVSVDAAGIVTVADQRPGAPDGTDRLTSIEALTFADASYAAIGQTAPVAGADTAATAQDAPVTIAVLANDNDGDPEFDQPLTLASVTATGGTAAVQADGTVRFTPDEGFLGKAAIDYRISDGLDTAPGRVDITVWADRTGFKLGTAAADSFTGGGATDRYAGGAGDDTINGMSGNDTLYGEGGNDTLYGSYGDDVLGGDAGDDQLLGQNGNDQLFGSGGNDALSGGDGADLLYGGGGDDVLAGGAHSDTLGGGGGNDRIDGGQGNDVLTGGAGSDVFVVGAALGADTITDFESGGDALAISGAIRRYFYSDDSHDGRPDTFIDFGSGSSVKLLDVMIDPLASLSMGSPAQLV